MTKQEQEHMNRAKAWCFDNNVSESQISACWDNAAQQNVPIIVNLNKNGHKWWWLAPHLLQQLVDRYNRVGDQV